MADFTAKIRAVLDTKGIQSQIQNLTKGRDLDIKVNLKGATADIDKFLNGLKNQARNSGNSAGSSFANAFNSSIGKINVSTGKSAIADMQRTLKSMKFDHSSIDSITKDLEQMSLSVDKVTTRMNSNGIRIQVNGIDEMGRAVTVVKQFDSESGRISTVSKQISQSFREVAQAAEKMASTTQINKLDAQMTTWLNSNNKATNFYKDSVKQLQSDLRALASAGQVPETALKNLENRFRTFGEQAKAAGVSGKEAIEKMASGSQIAKLDAQMTTWLNNNTKGNNQYRQSVQELQNSLRGMAASGQVPISTLREISGQFSAFTAQARAAGVAGKSFGDTLKSAFSQVSTYFSAAVIMSKSVSTIKDMARNVLEVDTALTELYRVSDLSEKQYDKLYQGMTQSAKDYGVALSDIIDSTASWVRLGFNANDASGLAEITAMYQHVTDLDNSTAVNNLVTAYKGFEKQLMELTGGDSTKAVERTADIYDALGAVLPMRNYIG